MAAAVRLFKNVSIKENKKASDEASNKGSDEGSDEGRNEGSDGVRQGIKPKKKNIVDVSLYCFNVT